MRVAPDGWLSVADAADTYNISASWLYRLIRKGRLTARLYKRRHAKSGPKTALFVKYWEVRRWTRVA